MLDECPRDSHPNSVRLASRTTTSDPDSDVELTVHFSGGERLSDPLLMRGTRKIVLEGPGVDRPRTLAGREHNTGDGGFSAAPRLYMRFRHRSLFGT